MASLIGIDNSDEYKALLGTALDRSALGKVAAYQSDTISKAAARSSSKTSARGPSGR